MGLDQLQLRSLRSFFGVARSHPRVFLLVEMDCLPLCWEARVRCMKFWPWHKVMTHPDYENCIIKKVTLDALSVNGGSWIRKLQGCFIAFGWNNPLVSCQDLRSCNGSQLQGMLRNCAERRIILEWHQEMATKPKLIFA